MCTSSFWEDIKYMIIIIWECVREAMKHVKKYTYEWIAVSQYDIDCWKLGPTWLLRQTLSSTGFPRDLITQLDLTREGYTDLISCDRTISKKWDVRSHEKH